LAVDPFYLGFLLHEYSKPTPKRQQEMHGLKGMRLTQGCVLGFHGTALSGLTPELLPNELTRREPGAKTGAKKGSELFNGAKNSSDPFVS
jgi:hypothetical protein